MKGLRVTQGVLLMLCLMYFITYLDRVNVSTAAEGFAADFHLNKTQIGLVFSAFAYPYLLFQIWGGWISDRYGARRTLIACGTIWAAATVMTGHGDWIGVAADCAPGTGLWRGRHISGRDDGDVALDTGRQARLCTRHHSCRGSSRQRGRPVGDRGDHGFTRVARVLLCVRRPELCVGRPLGADVYRISCRSPALHAGRARLSTASVRDASGGETSSMGRLVQTHGARNRRVFLLWVESVAVPQLDSASTSYTATTWISSSRLCSPRACSSPASWATRWAE